MENIREFAETIKGIQMSQVIDIGIAILIYILFRCLRCRCIIFPVSIRILCQNHLQNN